MYASSLKLVLHKMLYLCQYSDLAFTIGNIVNDGCYPTGNDNKINIFNVVKRRCLFKIFGKSCFKWSFISKY